MASCFFLNVPITFRTLPFTDIMIMYISILLVKMLILPALLPTEVPYWELFMLK